MERAPLNSRCLGTLRDIFSTTRNEPRTPNTNIYGAFCVIILVQYGFLLVFFQTCLPVGDGKQWEDPEPCGNLKRFLQFRQCWVAVAPWHFQHTHCSTETAIAPCGNGGANGYKCSKIRSVFTIVMPLVSRNEIHHKLSLTRPCGIVGRVHSVNATLISLRRCLFGSVCLFFMLILFILISASPMCGRMQRCT